MAEPFTENDATIARARARAAVEAEAADRARAQAAAIPDSPNFLEGFLDFIKQIFAFLFRTEGAEGESVPPTPVAEAREVVSTIVSSHAYPAWARYQAEHPGEVVRHQSPVAAADRRIVVTSEFGNRMHPKDHVMKPHGGVDIGVVGNQSHPNILASAGGVVLFSGPAKGYGNLVTIGHADGSVTRYGHLTGAQMPQLGSIVDAGAVIGVMGTEGRSTGPHLHYEQRASFDGPAHAPVIAGYGTLTLGETIDPAKARMAALADPSAHPNLASSATGTPAPLAFAGGKTKTAVVAGLAG